MRKDTGGLAFPHEYGSTAPGMTLRDYFAAKAMQGLMVGVEQPRCDYIADLAYEMADEMLQARQA